MEGRFGLDTTANSLQTPQLRLIGTMHKAKISAKDSQGLFEFNVLQRECSELTNRLGYGHDLRAVKRQVAERPDDRMNLLHNVK